MHFIDSEVSVLGKSACYGGDRVSVKSSGTLSKRNLCRVIYPNLYRVIYPLSIRSPGNNYDCEKFDGWKLTMKADDNLGKITEHIQVNFNDILVILIQ